MSPTRDGASATSTTSTTCRKGSSAVQTMQRDSTRGRNVTMHTLGLRHLHTHKAVPFHHASRWHLDLTYKAYRPSRLVLLSETSHAREKQAAELLLTLGPVKAGISKPAADQPRKKN
jgi:hypothetical protein